MNCPTTLQVVFICDDGYVLPTVVAIQSLVENGLDGRAAAVHVVCADLSDANERLFERFASETISVHVVRASATDLASLHHGGGDMCVATPAALLKFSLGELLPDLDRVLYLDGDVLVRGSLAPLWDEPLDGWLLAAAPDTGTLYCRRPIHREVKTYFNSGVMLLNLALMRQEKCAEKLRAAKRAMQDHALMDQDVFNRVCDGRVKILSPRWNTLFQNLSRAFRSGGFVLSEFNARFGTRHGSISDLGREAVVLHFASKDKPWNDETVPYADAWDAVFNHSPYPRRESHGIHTVALMYAQLGKGGIERSASFQIPMFVRMGYRVVVFTSRPSTGSDYDIGCDFEHVGLADTEGRPALRAEKLRRILTEKKVDLLIHHDAYYPELLRLDIRAARMVGVPVAVFWNSVFSHFFLRPGRQMEARSLFAACEKACAVLTLTRTDEAFFRMKGIPSLAMPFADPDLLAGFQRRAHPRRLLWLGRLVELKQPIHALRIFEKVHRRFPDAELVMLGDGDARIETDLRNWLRSNPACSAAVHLEGFRKDVRPSLERAGIGLVTSRFDGFCHSIVEMKMAAMPVVAYEMPYLDTLKPDSGAICVPQGDVQAAADAVVRLFDDEDEFARQSRLARASYEELASVDEEGRYRRLFAWLEGHGKDDDFRTVEPIYAKSVVETFVLHAEEALRIVGESVREEWARDRSYRLGRLLTGPYRAVKRLLRSL